MMKLYGTILVLLIIFSSCGSVCAEIDPPENSNIQTHIDIYDKSTYQHVYIPKGKNWNIKAELWADKACFGHDKPLTHEELIWYTLDMKDHCNIISTNYRSTNMFGNSYQTFKTSQLEKGNYAITIYYGGGQSDLLAQRYISSSKSIIISVT